MIQGVTFNVKDMPWFTWLCIGLAIMFIAIGIGASFMFGYSTITYKKAINPAEVKP